MPDDLHRTLPREVAVLLGPNPPDADGIQTERLHVRRNDSNTTWVDPAQHDHTESEAIFFVLKGSIEVQTP